MSPTRRLFAGSLATLPLASLAASKPATATSLNANAISALFEGLPGRVAYKIWAPATDSGAQLLFAHNAAHRLFVGSAIKTFILAETLIQADTPDVVATLTSTQLPLDASIWSLDSPTFDPPNLSGTVSLRTALEAMIIHSDNTGTDIALKHAGVDNVRSFIASAGLKSTDVPDSTRSFSGYLLGAPDYKTFTWAELAAAAANNNASIVNPPLNDVETLASSANDFVSYYSKALQGHYFKNSQTLAEFRRILSLADVISLLPFPLGASAFSKGGSIDVPGFHTLCVPGAIFFDNRWVYFSFIINWDAAAVTDPATVTAFLAATSQALTLVFHALST